MSYREQLIAKAQMGQLVLLIGLDLPSTATGLPSGKELAHGLAELSHQPVADSLVAVAEGLRKRNLQWKYTGYLKQALPAKGEPGAVHKIAAALPLPYLMTAAYDDRLALALKAADRPANLLLEDKDLTPLQPARPKAPHLIKLCGDLSPNRLHTLVVAEGEYTDLLLDDDRTALFDRVGDWLAEKTVLLVGCDPAASSDFRNQLYREVLELRGAFDAGAYLVWPGPATEDVAHWAARGATVIDAEPVAFLTSLAEGLKGVQVTLPEDEELAALKSLTQMLKGKPSQAEVSAALSQLPAARQPQSIALNFRFWLSVENKLQSILDIDYAPNLTHYSGQPVDTGITLQKLRNWADKAAEVRRELIPPQDSSVEQRGREFLGAILPPDSAAREHYELALRDGQMLNAELRTVFELLDEGGRLAPIPWELLHDGDMAMGRGFLGLKYPVYRLPSSVVGLEQIGGHIHKALIVAAEPTGKLKGLDGDVDEIVKALTAAGVAQVDAYRTTDAKVDDPQAIKHLIRSGYQLFHFIGHGLFNDSDPSRSKILLGLEGHRDKVLTATELAEAAREGQLVLVFLSACEVGFTDELLDDKPWKEAGIVDGLIRAGVPTVVGMRWRVGKENNQEMVRVFYANLLNADEEKRESSEKALMHARQAIQTQADWANPILTKRHGVL